MTVSRAIAAAVVVASFSLVFAGPAWADDFSGIYSLNLIGAPSPNHTSWTAHSTCSPSGGCVATVTSSNGWTGNARLVGGRWTMTVDRGDGQSCPDGTRHSEFQTWSWDAVTLDGDVSGVSTDPLACPQGQPDAFTLTKVRTA